MKRSFLALTAAMGLFLGVTTAALADSGSAADAADFGQHVADMAPHCPQMHGLMFGECVSMMARGECPHQC